MNNPMITALEVAFAEFDAANAAKSLEWARGRVKALADFANGEEAAEIKKGKFWSHAYYNRVFMIAGGKGWWQLFSGCNDRLLVEAMAKNSKAIADKRNATIVKKLAKIGITEIGELNYTRTNDGGFNGMFSFNNVAIEIRTIGAGGYNVQCYHERTLVYANDKRI